MVKIIYRVYGIQYMSPCMVSCIWRLNFIISITERPHVVKHHAAVLHQYIIIYHNQLDSTSIFVARHETSQTSEELLVTERYVRKIKHV